MYGNLVMEMSNFIRFPPEDDWEHLVHGRRPLHCSLDRCHPRQSDMWPITYLPSCSGPVSVSRKNSLICNKSLLYPQVSHFRPVLPEMWFSLLVIIISVNKARHVYILPIGYCVPSKWFNRSRTASRAASILIDLVSTRLNPSESIFSDSVRLRHMIASTYLKPCKETYEQMPIIKEPANTADLVKLYLKY